MQRLARQIIDTIEYNLAQMEDLTVDELELLKKAVDSLILYEKKIKREEKES